MALTQTYLYIIYDKLNNKVSEGEVTVKGPTTELDPRTLLTMLGLTADFYRVEVLEI